MTRKEQIFKITLTAVLTALTVVIAFLPIRTLGLEITLTVIPIAIGAIIGGKYVGLFLGTAFGITSFIQCLGYSAFGLMMFQINPFLTFLVCVPTRMLAGFLTGYVHELIVKLNKKEIANIVACVMMPILNTLFFMSVLVICFYNTEYIQGFVGKLNALNPVHFIILFVGINGLVEIIVGILVSFPTVKALQHSLRIK